MLRDAGCWSKNMVDEQKSEITRKEDGSNAHGFEEEVRDILSEGLEGSSLDEKVENLKGAIHQVAEDLSEWQALPRGVDVETFQTLRKQVEDVQSEWKALSASLQSQRERLDALLQSFPGAAEISTVRTLAMRVNNLEGLVDQLLTYHRAEEARRTSHIQIWLSVAALAATVLLWGGWVAYNLLAN